MLSGDSGDWQRDNRRSRRGGKEREKSLIDPVSEEVDGTGSSRDDPMKVGVSLEENDCGEEDPEEFNVAEGVLGIVSRSHASPTSTNVVSPDSI